MKTFRKYVEIARVMRVTNSTVLDIKDLTPLEAANVVELVKNDALFSFFDEFKDMDIQVLYAAVKYLECEEEYKKVRVLRSVIQNGADKTP